MIFEESVDRRSGPRDVGSERACVLELARERRRREVVAREYCQIAFGADRGERGGERGGSIPEPVRVPAPVELGVDGARRVLLTVSGNDENDRVRGGKDEGLELRPVTPAELRPGPQEERDVHAYARGDLVKLLVDNGYSGAISSEYEGWHWNSWQSPFDIIAAEQAVQRSAANDAGSRMITDAAEARRILDTHLRKAVQA